MPGMDRYLGQILDNRYEILEVIGTGGMAVVYKAMCHRLNRFVAVKIMRDDAAMDPEAHRRFQNESQAVAMLSHPNIVSVYDISRSGEIEYIVMELIEGINLKQYMNKKGTLSWKETLHFATQIVRALDHAHSKGIIHRDIKPHNIMLCKDGSVKVADFGIARLSDNQATLTQEALGSVHYISPEQAKGEQVDSRTDIYSVGVVLYEMLTGHLPFDGDSPVAVAIQHISAFPTMPRELNAEVPAALEAITMKAMNPNLSERYQSAAELLADLEEFRKNKNMLVGTADSVAVSGNDGHASAEKSAAANVVSPDTSDSDSEEKYAIVRNVRPISRSGELSKEGYARRRTRSNKISMLLGFFIVVAFILVVAVFLWNYWLKSIFEDAERINIPKFVGSYCDDIIKNEDFDTVFNFTVQYIPDADYPAGMIIDQSPNNGKSMMVVSEGIDIQLTVSSGIQMVPIPDVVNKEYRDAVSQLEALGLVVETTTDVSGSITKDYVISTSPAAGDELSVGATIYMTISAGPEIVPVIMPNLLGLTRAGAIARLESFNLTVGTISPVESEEPEGTIIWQSIDPYTEVTEHTKVYLQVSTGPKETEPPVTESPSEPEVPGEGTVAPPLSPATPSNITGG